MMTPFIHKVVWVVGITVGILFMISSVVAGVEIITIILDYILP